MDIQTLREAGELCDLCGGELAIGTTELRIRVQGDLVVIENLPAAICNQCGEAYFSADISHKIDQLVAHRKDLKPLRYESAPVYSPELVT